MDQFYKYFRWLSLDIVLGAIFFLVYLEKYYGLDLSCHVHFALGSAIWLIYTTDHLIDARSVEQPSNERHQFHQRCYRSLIFLAGLVIVMALLNVYFLDLSIVRNGALLSAGCIGYLMLVYFFKNLWVKELLVACAYAFGIFLAPLSIIGGFSVIDVILVLELTSIALLNLLIFSFFDSKNDLNDGFSSLVLRLGMKISTWLINVIFIAVVLLSAALFFLFQDSIQLLFMVMTLVLGFVFHVPKYFSFGERFRIVGDGIFYLAGLFLLL